MNETMPEIVRRFEKLNEKQRYRELQRLFAGRDANAVQLAWCARLVTMLREAKLYPDKAA